MGLFGKKIEIKKEFFKPCLSFNKFEVANYRERQGFKVKIENSYKKLIVKSTVGGFLKFIQITDYFWDNGERAYSIFFPDFPQDEVISFLNSNFKYDKKKMCWILEDGNELKVKCDNGSLSCRIGNASYYGI